tara:strand:- start:35 stop:382 length:348 start_codon:yes stop_codon:yes gene_type:complete
MGLSAVTTAVKLGYKPAMTLAKKLAKKYWSEGSNKKDIVKEAKEKNILQKFNNFKLKYDPKKPLDKKSDRAVSPTAGKKPSLDTYEDTGAGVGRKKGGYIKKYAKGGGVRKANYT